MDKRQKNNLMTTIALIVVFGQFILWIILLLLDSERRNICTHEDMYELTCIKCGKTMSINLADPNYINK